MIRAVVWKELREQGLIAIMLTVLGGALLVAAAVFADPPMPNAPMTDIVGALGAGRLLTLMLVVTAGMVCGGALFAAEKESGTIAFLEALPTGHWALWRAKLVAGLLLALAEVLGLMAVAAALGLADASFLARLFVYALLAFAWGTLGSTLARTTLGSVGIAIPAATLASFFYLFPIFLLFARPGSGGPPPTGWAAFELLMLGTPLALSAWRFTAPDRARSAETASSGPAASARAARPRKPGSGVRAVAWLTAQQLRTPGTVLSLFALAFGLALLLPTMRPLFLWPVLALAAGVLAGVTAFGDEQAHQTARFWSEHRLPVGRAWWVKIGTHFGFLLWLLVLAALPCVVRAQVETSEGFGRGRSSFAGIFQSRLFDELGPQALKFLLVPAVYGFAFGHVCGLLFRKLVVATGVATMLAGTCAAVWEMSLLAGGVTHWQVWLPAGAVLLTGRALIRGWAADRATARGPLTRLGAAAGVFVVALVGGVAYRVLEIPDDPTGGDDAAFAARLPTYDENVAGRDFRTAADRFARLAAASTPEPPRVPDARRRPRIDERLEAAVRFGWPADDPELAEYLDRVFDDPPTAPGDKPWPDMAADAAGLAPGVYELPQLVGTTAATAAALDNARRMAVALLVRGLQNQARDPGAFLKAFQTVTALARTMRSGGGLLALDAAGETERAALRAADQWLKRLTGRADLARTLARAAAGADDPAPFDPRPYHLADRFVIRGQMRAPGQWLTSALVAPRADPERVAAEADLVAFAWSLPWERERTRRLADRAPDPAPRDWFYPLVRGRPGAGILLRNRPGVDPAEKDIHLRVARRALVLTAAISAYQLDRGGPPAALADLVAQRYLDRLPDDPFTDGKPFGYRVSTGETLRAQLSTNLSSPNRSEERLLVLDIERGRALLWSVGADRIDQGGHVPPDSQRAEDIVFLAPLPPHGPK